MEGLIELLTVIATAILAAGGTGGGVVWYFKRDTHPNGGKTSWDRVWKEFDIREKQASKERRMIHERTNEISDRVSRIEGYLGRTS